MFKFIIITLTVCFMTQAKTSSESLITAEELSSFSAEDKQLIKASFPELMKHDVTKGVAVVATIGPPGCDFNVNNTATPIQDAIDWSPTYTELRIVEGLYHEENITLDDRSIIIKGGYATCADAANDVMSSPDSLNTIIQSYMGATNPAFSIRGSTTSNSVIFYNLTIRNSGSNDSYGGAISVDNADVNISLNNVAMSHNTAFVGGALAIVGSTGNANVVLNSVQVNNNGAQEGGGLYCNSPNAHLTINSSSGKTHGVYNNSATAGDGGGAFITNGCTFTSYQGTKTYGFNSDDYRGISHNTATGNGGGLALTILAKANLYGRNTCVPSNQSWLCLFGNNSEPVNMFSNIADADDDDNGNGGAIYVSQGGKLLAENVYLVGNSSVNGGAVSFEGIATVTIKTAFSNEAGAISCWQPGGCVVINNNTAKVAGGGFYVTSPAKADVANLKARNNRAMIGVMGYVEGVSAELNFESGLFYGNGDNGSNGYNDTYLFSSNTGSKLNIHYSTIVDNKVGLSQISNNEAYVAMGNSIIYDPNGVNIYTVSSGSPYHFIGCLLVHENQSFNGINDVIVGDPLFEDSGNNDYRLTDSSPAIDMCDQQWVTAAYPDLLGNTRGFDVPDVPNFIGPYDAGVYENISSDIIFKHGFE